MNALVLRVKVARRYEIVVNNKIVSITRIFALLAICNRKRKASISGLKIGIVRAGAAILWKRYAADMEALSTVDNTPRCWQTITGLSVL